jgi:uncharacterized membrane protein YhiD involved in acid resistance
MSNWTDSILQNDFGTSVVGPETMLLVLLMAFCIGHIIGWVYMWTHAGLSYSQMFVASLVIMPPLVAFVMGLMASDIVIAFGLLGVFAVVRFRNVLKDTRDATFILWAMCQGMAVGTMRFSTALIGCFCISLILLYLRITSFGGRHRYDVIVSLQTQGDGTIAVLKQILRRHSVRVQLASQRDLADQARDLSYRLLLRNPARSGELLTELESTTGINHVSLYHREDESEI